MAGMARSDAVFLELLAREAPAVEFEAPLLAARAAGADPVALEELEATKQAALRVRALLERRRRREAELAALFETASDLAGLRELDAVLEAIVRRARQLLGTDIAYMTLEDRERGDTAMRVTDGSVSARFRRVRLPMGAGLGGLVAQTSMPYATADYFADSRFRHLSDIDVAVREEGLVAILGVPMRLGGRVIGVLFAANRSARPFAHEEVALLGSLAGLAAVAIDSARLLAETRTALDELGVANERWQARSRVVERAAEAHDRMTTLVVTGGGVEEVAAVVTDVLGGALAVFDADGRRLAAVGETGLFDGGPPGVTAGTGRAARQGDWWVVPITAGAEPLGTLAYRAAPATASHEADADGDVRILERAALVTALLLLFRRSVADAESRVRGDLLDDLLIRPTDDLEPLRARARLLGVALPAPDVPHVLVVASHGGDPQRAGFWASTLASARHGLAAGRRGEVVLLLPGEEAGPLGRQVAADLGAALGTPVTAGAAGPLTDPAALPDGYARADRCARALVSLGRAGSGAAAEDLGFVGLLLGDDVHEAHGYVHGYVRQVLGPVLDYDTRRGTALVPTLRAYFTAGGSLAKAAAELHVHVNTVSQRLDRIGRLLGRDWQQPERALEIQLALRIDKLSDLG
jgi:sugar diacid utilization regulator